MQKAVRSILIFLAVAVLFVQGSTVAQTTEKLPLVLVVYADWCPMCQKLKPTLAKINEKYYGKIHFVRFDITSEETTVKSKRQALKLGLGEFFEKNKDKTSLVVIQDSAGREVFRALSDYDPRHYEAVLDKQLRETQK